MIKLLFIYDSLMLKETQESLSIDMEFYGFAYTKAKLYFMNDTMNRRYFLLPMKTINMVYGAIYVINNWEFERLKICSFYNNSIPYFGITIQEDLYDLQKITCRPIKFNIDNLKNWEYSKYKEDMEIECFIGNKNSNKVKNSMKNGSYYRVKNFDKESLSKLLICKKQNKIETQIEKQKERTTK